MQTISDLNLGINLISSSQAGEDNLIGNASNTTDCFCQTDIQTEFRFVCNFLVDFRTNLYIRTSFRLTLSAGIC